MDIYTIGILERFLKSYKGCAIIVSHDRSFMDNLVDHIFVFEGEGRIRDYHSNYTEYREAKQKQDRAIQKQRKEVHNEDLYREQLKAQRANDKPKATYKEKKEYEQLTAEIEALTAERKEIESMLSSGTETDPAKITAVSERIGQLIATLDEKEIRWLELDEIIN